MGNYGAFKSVVRARVEKFGGKEKLREELLKSPGTSSFQVISDNPRDLDEQGLKKSTFFLGTLKPSDQKIAFRFSDTQELILCYQGEIPKSIGKVKFVKPVESREGSLFKIPRRKMSMRKEEADT